MISNHLHIVIAFSLTIIYWFISRLARIGTREAELPPGPPTIPLLGNLLQFPKEYTFLRFTEWARTYGGIYSLKIGPRTVIVVTNPRIMRDFMDKRSVATGDRPPSKIGDLITNGLHIALARSGPLWKQMRRAMSAFLTREACAGHIPIQVAESKQLLYDMLKSPENTYAHLGRQSASVLLSLLFGTRAPSINNPLACRFARVIDMWICILEPGATPPLDLLPFLQYVPECWASWKPKCRQIREDMLALAYGFMNMNVDRIKQGKRVGCFMEDLLDNQESLGLSDEQIAFIGQASLEGGAETTTLFLRHLILYLGCYPDIQRRAQDEIDNFIGPGRMPSLHDFDHLPYSQAVVKEIIRIFPPVPLAAPHATVSDEVVDGYRIPKGSTVFLNIYGIYNDPTFFDEPERFMPERFLDSEFGTKPGADTAGFRADLHFGSGRRICPGIILGNSSIKINALNLLWAFNYRMPDIASRDPQKPITYRDFKSGITAGVKPFKCDITVRSDAHADLIRSSYEEARSVFAIFEQELSQEDISHLSEQ
ncbi:cytochrome P450 [Panus rudis PR-1116 ss-1]|nr:cytochrome P450 [Panus rudis PR-1116 ss-1]